MYVFGGRLIRPDDFELPLLNDLIPIPGLCKSRVTNLYRILYLIMHS